MTATLPTQLTRAIRPVTAEELPALVELALADGHATILPTHVFEKNGEICGHASVGAICLVVPWFHTQRCQARDSLWFIRQLEQQVARDLPAGHPGLVGIPFPMTSPFQPLAAKLGFHSTGLMDVCLKVLR